MTELLKPENTGGMKVVDDCINIHFEIRYYNQTILLSLAVVSRCLGWHKEVRDKKARENLRMALQVDDTCILKDLNGISPWYV